MEPVLALLGLLVGLQGVALLTLGVILYRHHRMLEAAAGTVRTLVAAWQAQSGQQISLDPVLAEDAQTAVAPDEDVVSRIAEHVSPWVVRDE